MQGFAISLLDINMTVLCKYVKNVAIQKAHVPLRKGRSEWEFLISLALNIRNKKM